jgi:RHS repeat-associated protein
MFGKGNAMISTVSILLVIMLTIGANPAYFDTSSSIINPESTHSRINRNEKPLPEQKNVSIKMCQTQSKHLEKQGHTRFKSIIGWKLHLTPYYFHTNEIDSVIAITDENGNTVERVSYDTFGMPTFKDAAGEAVSKSTIGSTFLFHGHRYDAETNLYYFRARYYDPIMGRFLKTDPLGYEDSMNLYQGFNQNPGNFTDPMGTVLNLEFLIDIYGSVENAEDVVKSVYAKFRLAGDTHSVAYRKLITYKFVIDTGSKSDELYERGLAFLPSLGVFDVTPAQFAKNLAGGVTSAVTKLISFVVKCLPGRYHPNINKNIDKGQKYVQSKINKAIGANEGSLGYWIGETYAPAIAGGILAAELECANATAQTENILPVKNLKSFVDVKYKTPATVDELIEMMNKRPDVKAKIAVGDKAAFLKYVEAEGSHMMDIDGVSHILLREDVATRHTAFHEWLHHVLQKKAGGITPGEEYIIEEFLRRFKNILKLK